MRTLIKEMAARKCIVISTHILEEVESICNRIVIIDQGEILVDSTPKQLCEREGGSLEKIFRKLTTQHLQIDVKGGAA